MSGTAKTIDQYISEYGEIEGKKRYDRAILRKDRIMKGRGVKLGDDPEKDVAEGRAIVCQACGAIVTRLQWTHFRDKCVIKTLAEYKAKFPGTPIVAPELSKKTAVTFENLVKIYGEEEGASRWQAYCRKQAETNTFEYKMERYGWSKDDFDAYNKSRACTVEMLVSRHGQDEGMRKWEEYCERQRFTNSLQYFIDREGDEERGRAVWLEYNHQKGSSARPVDIAAKLGITVDEACAIVYDKLKTGFVSNAEIAFVCALEAALGEEVKYTRKTKQFCIWSEEAAQPFFYDLCCTSRMKIIEFHGDYWHTNPVRFGPNDYIPQVGKRASEIWDRDHVKLRTATARGFEVMVVWESDFISGTALDRVIKWFNT